MKHKHHIVPKSMGGTDHPSNLVEVSVEEHAELHLDLYLQYGRWQDWIAYHCLSNMNEEARISAVRKTLTGKHLSPEHKAKISKGKNGRKQTHIIPQEARSHHARKQKVSFRATSPEGIVFIHTGIQDFCRQYNLPHSSVHRCIHNQAKSCSGWTFSLVSK